MNIRWLTRNEIDDTEWNKTVSACATQLPYAFSWYLDAVAENWCAVVAGKYEAILPLPYFTKWGIKYLYQPHYCQQLGIFGVADFPPDIIEEMMRMAVRKFALAHYQLHTGASALAKVFGLIPRKNLLLNLALPYESLKKNFSQNHHRNIAKAIKNDLVFSAHNPMERFVEFYLQYVDRVKEKFTSKHEKCLVELCNAPEAKNMMQYAAVTTPDAKWLAAVLLLHYGNRKIALINCSSPQAKRQGGSHYMFDRLIAQHAGQPIQFDFEGSNIATVARFYEGFGAAAETYYLLKQHPLQRFGIKKHL